MVARNKVVDQEPWVKKPSATAPQPVAAAPEKDETEAKPKLTEYARVYLITGKSSTSHGRQWVERQPQNIVDEALIVELKNDGNFSVEMVPVTGGKPASPR